MKYMRGRKSDGRHDNSNLVKPTGMGFKQEQKTWIKECVEVSEVSLRRSHETTPRSASAIHAQGSKKQQR